MSQPRRVDLVVTQLGRRVPGGIGTYCRGLLAGLAACGPARAALDLHVVTAGSAERRDASSVPACWAHRRLALPVPLVTRAWDHGWLAVGGPGAVVHATSLAVPPTRGGPLIVTVHDLLWRSLPDAFPAGGRQWHERALGRALGTARHLVVPSAETADALVAAGADHRSISVIAHGADHLPPPDLVAASALLGRLGVSEPFFLSVGTVEPRKNLARLVAAYRRAASGLGDPPDLVVVGPRGWGSSLEGAAAARQRPGRLPTPEAPSADGGRPGRVVVAGPVDAAVLAALYQRALALAYVPLAEGYGLPPVEAMRAGTPVVASPMPSVGEAALVVDPTDVGAIAEALRRVAGDPDERERLVHAGRMRAARSWRDAAAEHLELWAQLR